MFFSLLESACSYLKSVRTRNFFVNEDYLFLMHIFSAQKSMIQEEGI